MRFARCSASVLTALAVTAVLALAPVAVRAQGTAALRVGIPFSPQTIDPLHSSTSSNDEAALQMFDALSRRTSAETFEPSLAESWTQLDPLTWQFRLRRGVTFHDGAPFTAAQVLRSVARAGDSNGPSPYSLYVRDIAGIDVLDPHTLHIRTREPFPLLIPYLNRIHIIGGEEGVEPHAGAPPPGTGAFRFVSFRPGDRLELRRNDQYWRGAAAWERVSFRVVSATPARDAALLAGDLDVIANPGRAARERGGDGRIVLHTAAGNTIIYIGLDQRTEGTPRGVRGTDRNPFRDPRVREALSVAIDRAALTERVLGGDGVPAEQPLPPGRFGRPDDIARDSFSTDRARTLLGEARFPNGFETTLSFATDRFSEAQAVGQAVAQMLARAGIRVTVEAMPFSVYRSRVGRGELPLYIAAYGNPHGDASAPIRALTGLISEQTGFGSQNFGGYRNEEQNRLLIESFRETDVARRRALLEEMTRITMRERAILPLYWEANVIATRPGLAMQVRADGMIVAAEIRPAQ